MATYAVGDVQGCLASLRRLTDRFRFDPRTDVLWFVGDLVNRGDDSAGVLRFVRDLGRAAVTVLGNHDLHLLATAWGVRAPRVRDTFDDVLRADDRDELLAWLRERPLLHRERGRVLVHAGIPPAWTLDEAQSVARAASRLLAGPDGEAMLSERVKKDARCPPATTRTMRGLARAARMLTRIRTVDAQGAPDLEFAGPPAEAPPGAIPWFDHPARSGDRDTIVCGHWAALGLVQRPGLVALDTGHVWGGPLTAVRLEDGMPFHVR